MSWWLDEARTGAAREFGARHHRAFSVVEIAIVIARFLLPLAGLAALGLAAWWLIGAFAALPPWLFWAALALCGLAVVAVIALLLSRSSIRFYGLRSLRRW
jgi:hypothetical protein